MRRFIERMRQLYQTRRMSSQTQSGCMFSSQFLLWLPSHDFLEFGSGKCNDLRSIFHTTWRWDLRSTHWGVLCSRDQAREILRMVKGSYYKLQGKGWPREEQVVTETKKKFWELRVKLCIRTFLRIQHCFPRIERHKKISNAWVA